MFEDIGKNTDIGRRRRQAESALYTLILAGAAGTLAGMLTTLPPRITASPEPDDPFVAIDPATPDDGIAKAAPPPPPAGRADGAERVEPEPDEPVEPTGPPDVVEPRIVDANRPAKGSEHGVVDGRTTGRPGGTRGGTCGGDDCGDGGSGSQLPTPVFRRRVEPVYPPSTRRLGLPDQRCVVRVWVRPDGRADSVDVTGCPPAFQEETRRAMIRSRWKPFDATTGTLAPFELRVTFRLDAD